MAEKWRENNFLFYKKSFTYEVKKITSRRGMLLLFVLLLALFGIKNEIEKNH